MNTNKDPSNNKDPSDKMTLIEHLTELRKRLLWSFVILFLVFCVSFYFADELFYFLAKPLVNLMDIDNGAEAVK